MDKTWLENLEIGEHFTVSDMQYVQIMLIIKTAPGNYIVNEITENDFMIVRVKEKKRIKSSNEFRDILKNLHLTGDIEIHVRQRVGVNAQVSYMRSMLSKYNTDNGRAIKLSCVNGEVFLHEKVDVISVSNRLGALISKEDDYDDDDLM